jgi:uncharacterized DUF497 family protein
MQFEWDPRKNTENQRKHRISFEEAATVFSDPLASIFDDPDHSVEERRELIVGFSARNRLVVVCPLNGPKLCDSLVHARGRQENESDMNKKTRARADDLRKEYEFDYQKARPNRFASAMKKTAVAVVLDEDVAEVFGSSESVNNLLRSIIAAVPTGRTSKTRIKRRGLLVSGFVGLANRRGSSP